MYMYLFTGINLSFLNKCGLFNIQVQGLNHLKYKEGQIKLFEPF